MIVLIPLTARDFIVLSTILLYTAYLQFLELFPLCCPNFVSQNAVHFGHRQVHVMKGRKPS